MAVTHASDSYPVHRVPITRPFIWLQAGWDDMLHHRGASLAYGWIVATLGALILAYSRHPVYIAASIAGFLLVGPVITAGVCELSRRRDHGDQANFQLSLQSLHHNRAALLAFAAVLMAIGVACFALTALTLQLTTGSIAPAFESTVWADVLPLLSTSQAIVYAIAFALLAAAVFAVSVVTVPMIIDRHVDAATAMRMSLRVAARDLPALVLWVALIIALVLFGFATWLLGMILVLPLLGHATWHAYRDMVTEA